MFPWEMLSTENKNKPKWSIEDAAKVLQLADLLAGVSWLDFWALGQKSWYDILWEVIPSERGLL